MSHSQNLFSNDHRINKSDREKLLSQRALIVWFTGLSGSGKSTLANMLEEELHRQGIKTMMLDGDAIRKGLNKDLGFSPEARKENIRRIGEVCKLMNEAGLVTLASFISPFRAERDRVRSLVPVGEFFEIHVDTSLEVCETRDPNGLYKMARAGQIKEFTGIDSPYEIPDRPELRLDTSERSAEDCVNDILPMVLPLIRLSSSGN
jgi:adenylylsulfate kinase